MRGRWAFYAGATVAVAATTFAAPAAADHHLIKLSEVFAGSDASPNAEYVEMQMTASGQNRFGGSNSTVTLLAANGAVNLTVPLATNVANGQAGRRVLVGASDLSTSFGVTPDFSFASGDHLSRLGGAACFVSGVFGPVDCVSWGSFAGSPASPTGGNTAAMADTMAIRRAGPACGSGLTDTNSPSDWSQAVPDPSNNAAPAATGTACVNTTITRKPKARTQKRTARFEFSSTPASASFACKLGGGGFADCESPFSQRVGPGRHTFKVKAAGETSPATYRWKVVKK